VRRAYLALSWPSGGGEAERHVRACTEQMDAEPQWRRAADLPGLRLWTSRQAPPEVNCLPLGAGVVVGAVHDMPDARAEPSRLDVRAASVDTAWAQAVALSRRHWGAYVAILHGADGGAGLYRDPGGGLDCLTWSLGHGLEVVAAQVAPLPLAVVPRHPHLNWDRVAEFLALPSACTSQSLFDDVVAVDPGGFRALRAPGPAATRLLWTPSRFATDPIDDAPAAARELVARVDACTSALVGARTRVILELSGGLDSSILAGSVAATGLAARVSEGINFTFGRPESDETAYAQAVADRLGVRLVRRRHAPEGLDEAGLSELADAFHPAANSVDPAWDRDEIARLRVTGAQAVVSGQGGDAVFFQMPGAAIAADLVARDGWRAIAAPLTADVARRARTSVWAVARDVWRLGRGGGLTPDARSALVSSWVRTATQDLAHNWVRQARADGLTPGKQLHVLATAIFHGNLGPRRRRREADVLYPLFAQPVLEHCLRIPVPTLAGAAYDRAFARRAFADRIPHAVLRRRAKGLVTVYFAKLIANSLGLLRPYLLDGVLCEAGVLDRAAVETALDRTHLIWKARPPDILWATAMEGWVRHWQTQVPDSWRARRRS
jgi:asparagine synthase (glutamine-hydrolysing)